MNNERKENWTMHEFLSSITIRDGKKMVCRCTQNATGKKYATLIKTAPEMRDMLAFLLEFVENGGNEGEIRECYAPAIRDLLKKTRGEK